METLTKMLQPNIICLLLVVVKNASGQADALASVIEYSSDSSDFDRVDSSSSIELSAKDRVLIEESRAFDTGTPVNVLQRPTDSKFSLNLIFLKKFTELSKMT